MKSTGYCGLCLVLTGFVISICIIGSGYGFYRIYGCNEDYNICNPHWKLKSVEVVKFQDMNAYSYANCNCNNCVTSNTCNCDILQCYVIGQYDVNSQCKIASSYYITQRVSNDDNNNDNNNGHTVNVGRIDLEWYYDNMINTFNNYTVYSYYINNNRFPGSCIPEHEVNNLGKSEFNYFITLIVLCGSFSLTLILLCVMFYYIDSKNNDTYSTNFELSNM